MYPFSDGCFAPKNAWYIAALSHEVSRTPMERWFLDEPVVLFRQEDGTATALAGRCPHRQFPMAAGRLEGDVLICGYHGIAFKADGRCARIPTQDRVPPGFGLRKFPLVEKWKWMWIWMGDPALADEALIPDHDMLELHDEPNAEGHRSSALFYFEVKGRYQLLNDNLLDLSHLAYLHSSTIGKEAIATTADEVTSGETWVRSSRQVRESAPSPLDKQRHGDVPVDFLIDFTFHMPALHVGRNTTTVAQSVPDRAGEVLGDSVVYHAVTPATPTTCNYFWAVTVKKPIQTDADVEKMREGVAGVLAEDIFATEEIERLIGGRKGIRDLMTGGDVAVTKGRLMMERMMKREKAAAVATAAE